MARPEETDAEAPRDRSIKPRLGELGCPLELSIEQLTELACARHRQPV
jgi:hypothetical protein